MKSRNDLPPDLDGAGASLPESAKKAKSACRRLSFALKDGTRKGEQPLAEVFAEALRIVNRTGLRPDEPDDAKPLLDANWLARQAIRAVCEAIVQRGSMPSPLAVNLRCKESDARPIKPPRGRPLTIRAHPQFVALAARHGLHPAVLAHLACSSMAARNAEVLQVATCVPFDEMAARAVAFHEAHHAPTVNEDDQ